MLRAWPCARRRGAVVANTKSQPALGLCPARHADIHYQLRHISKKTRGGFQGHKVRTKLGLQMKECLPEKGALKWDRKKEADRCKNRRACPRVCVCSGGGKQTRKQEQTRWKHPEAEQTLRLFQELNKRPGPALVEPHICLESPGE